MIIKKTDSEIDNKYVDSYSIYIPLLVLYGWYYCLARESSAATPRSSSSVKSM